MALMIRLDSNENVRPISQPQIHGRLIDHNVPVLRGARFPEAGAGPRASGGESQQTRREPGFETVPGRAVLC